MVDSGARSPVSGYRVGDLVVDAAREHVTRGETELHLPKLSFDLFAALVRAAPELVSVDSLMRQVWPGLVIGPETVAQRVKLVRAALGDDSKQPRYVAGVRGRGYRVVAPVTPIDAAAGPSTWPPAAAQPASRQRPWRAVAVGALAASVLAAAGLAWWLAPTGRPVSIAEDTGTRNPKAYDAYLEGLDARPAAASLFATPVSLQNIEAAFTTAIALDPSFADAYAERAALRLLKVVSNVDTSREQIERSEGDVAAAEQLAPESPKTLAARAWYLMWIDGDAPGALAAFAAARDAGLSDAQWLLDLPLLLIRLGRRDEALQVLEQAWATDPRNTNTAVTYARYLAELNRPADALRALQFSLRRTPTDPLPRGYDMQIRWSYGGNVDFMRGASAILAAAPPWTDGSENPVPLSLAFDVLRWSGNLDRLEHVLGAVRSTAVRAPFPAAGEQPVARYRGWTRLMLGQTDAAAQHGREVLEFLASNEETPRNRSFRRLLAAEAYVFLREPDLAIAALRELDALPPPIYAHDPRLLKARAAVYAWSGARDEAVALLERGTTELPRIGPAEVIRDPLYTMPLADHARFSELASRLEAEIRNTSLD